MSKKQAIRLSEKKQQAKAQKDRTWFIVCFIIASVLSMLTVMRTFDHDRTVIEETPGLTCKQAPLHPLVAYASGAGIDDAIEAATGNFVATCD